MNSIHLTFDRVQDIPGYDFLAKNGHTDVINFLHNHIHDVDLCLQSIEHNSSTLAVNDEYGDLVSAVGWQVRQVLGKGKDGITFLGHRYNDQDKTIKTVKYLSKYAKQYLNHTILFNEIYKTVGTKNPNVFTINISENYTYYDSNEALVEIENNDVLRVLPELCRMNSWCIKHTGFAFWDFGFGSGKNYMMSDSNKLKWIDYGGSGIVRCPSFESIYTSNNNFSELTLSAPFGGKESLINADSNFLMCQFLLHIEYFANQHKTNADLWSSMLQVRRSVIEEFVEFLPSVLLTDVASNIYNKFKDKDWTDSITWKQLGKYLDANS